MHHSYFTTYMGIYLLMQLRQKLYLPFFFILSRVPWIHPNRGKPLKHPSYPLEVSNTTFLSDRQVNVIHINRVALTWMRRLYVRLLRLVLLVLTTYLIWFYGIISALKDQHQHQSMLDSKLSIEKLPCNVYVRKLHDTWFWRTSPLIIRYLLKDTNTPQVLWH